MNIAVSPELAAIVRTPPKIERIRITSREQWLRARSQDITASAAAALLGIHPYQTAYSLWAVKTGRLSDEIEDSPPLRRGRLLEPVAVQLLREERPDWQLSDYPVGLYFRDAEARLGATPDLLAHDENRAFGSVQIKSVEASVFRRDWQKEGGEVEPPLWIVVQALIEASLVGAQWAAVVPIVVGHGVELPVVPIPLHMGLLDRIKAEVAAFWRLVEEGRTPDPDYGRDGDLIAQLYAPNGTTIDLSGDNLSVDLVDENIRLSGEAKVIKDRKDAIKAEMLVKLGGASAGRLRDGRLITAKRVNRAPYSVEATSYIDLRIKKAQGAAA